MVAESAADRASLVDTDDFAVQATYILAGGGSSSIDIIFDAEYIETDLETRVQVATENPHCMCRTSDLPAGHKNGDQITIDGVGYYVRIPQPDGTGMSTLVLEAMV